jgi:branched-subunit amino acid ABC-type transport system permease component
MDDFLVTLKGSYSIVFLSVLAGFLLAFIDSKITGKEYSSKHYAKISLLIVVISSLIVYIHSLDLKIDEEIISGPAPF